MKQLPTILTSNEILNEWHPQIYKMTHLNSNMVYIGCVYAKGKWFTERFREHLITGDTIKNLIKLGYAKTNDPYTCELITLVLDHDQATKVEQYYISQIPRHQSINYITGGSYYQESRNRTVELIQDKVQRGWCTKLFFSDQEPSLLQQQIEFNVSSKADLLSLHTSIAAKYKTIIHENWINGRKKLAYRKGNGDLTDKEKEAYKQLPIKIATDWGTRSDEYIKTRTSPGLSSMNQTLTCPFCNRSISKGNYARYHGEKCKLNLSVA